MYFGLFVGRYSDQLLAQHLLQTRTRGRPSYRAFLLRNWKSYLFLVGTYGLALVLFGIARFWIPFAFLAGYIIAIFYRDFQHISVHRKVWPFNAKVTDWNRVEELAKDTTSVKNPD